MSPIRLGRLGPLASLLALVPLVPARSLAAQGTPPAQGVPVVKPWQFDVFIPEEPHLVDLAGKDHALFSENKDRAVLLVFFSWRDPVSRFYAPELAEIQAKHAEKLTIVLVDSNYDELVGGGDPLERLRKVIEAEKISLPVLLDHDNHVADDFGATANGQCFLVDANRFLRYHGGIDDDPDGSRRKQDIPVRTWLENAIGDVLRGVPPKEHWTRPSGRPIKRVPGSHTPQASAPKK